MSDDSNNIVAMSVDASYQPVVLSLIAALGARVVSRTSTTWRIQQPTPIDLLAAHMRAASQVCGRPLHQLRGPERLTAVTYLDRCGAFEVRGAVSTIAHALAVSPTTIYALRKETGLGGERPGR